MRTISFRKYILHTLQSYPYIFYRQHSSKNPTMASYSTLPLKFKIFIRRFSRNNIHSNVTYFCLQLFHTTVLLSGVDVQKLCAEFRRAVSLLHAQRGCRGQVCGYCAVHGISPFVLIFYVIARDVEFPALLGRVDPVGTSQVSIYQFDRLPCERTYLRSVVSGIVESPTKLHV